MGLIRLTYFDIADLPIWYIGASNRAFVYTADMNRILPSQEFITTSRLAFYNQRQRMVNDDHDLPFGIQFAGSSTIHLIDGHHRWYSCMLRGRKRFRLLVDRYEYSYTQAIVDAYKQASPPAAVVKQQPRRLLPPSAYQQLQLGFQ